MRPFLGAAKTRVQTDEFKLIEWQFYIWASTQPVFGVSDKARLKPVCSATENTQKIEKKFL